MQAIPILQDLLWFCFFIANEYQKHNSQLHLDNYTEELKTSLLLRIETSWSHYTRLYDYTVKLSIILTGPQ